MELLTPEFGLFFWTLLAFGIVFYILRKYAWKPILSSLSEREKGIADSIASAEKVKGEMSQMKAENEKLLTMAREERTTMLREAKEIKDKMINDAKEQAKVEANKIIVDAQRQIEQQKMAALTAVKNEISVLAIDVASRILRKEMSAPQNQENFLKMLSDDIKLN